MHGSSLSFENAKYQLLKERLLAEYPDADEKTLQDTLEGITDLHEMIAAIIRSALVDEALQVGLRTRLEDMRQRLARLEERGAKKRQLALEAMCEVGLKKLEQPDFTASARAGVTVPRNNVRRARSRALLGSPAPQARSPGAASRSEARRRDPRRATWQSPTHSCREDKVMAFTEAQVKNLEAKLRFQAREDASGARHDPRLCRRMACHRRGQPHLWL